MPRKISQVAYAVGDSDSRPWGHWRVIDAGVDHIAKRIEVLPGKRLSLQYHNHRSEHWLIVSGFGVALVGDDTIEVRSGGHVLIPVGTAHRVHNTGESPLVLIEVQLGDLLDESDIMRLDDGHGR